MRIHAVSGNFVSIYWISYGLYGYRYIDYNRCMKHLVVLGNAYEIQDFIVVIH